MKCAVSSAVIVLLTGIVPAQSSAQQVDSARAGVAAPPEVRRPVLDPSGRPYPSPRRAFVTSLAIPGSMQFRFGRPKAAMIFLLAEAGSVGMSLKSWNDLSKAKEARADTVRVPVLDGGGAPVIDPVTGQPRIDFSPRNKNLADRVGARRAHLEDWLAVVVFNHLFAGADAYVSANLADFDANVQVSSLERRVGVRARLAW
ncbi:MAG: hypothetical protein ACR2GK_09175 [Gemmatimonadaceae bacterium]